MDISLANLLLSFCIFQNVLYTFQCSRNKYIKYCLAEKKFNGFFFNGKQIVFLFEKLIQIIVFSY